MKHLFNPKKLRWTATLLLLAFLVKLIWLVAETGYLPATGLNQEKEVKRKALYYRVSLSSSKAPVPKKVVKRVPVANIKDISLLAIYSAEDATVVTVMHHNKTKVLSRGEEINGFTLEGAGRTYAVFSKKGKHYKIDLLTKKKSSGSGTIRVVNQNSSLEENSGKTAGEITDAGDHKIIDRSLFEHFTKNMDEVYKYIGISESRKDGRLQFKITFVKRGSPFAKLGVRRGDIIKSVNGQEIDSYNTAFNVYKNIGNVESLTMVIVRGKKEMELEYEIN